MRRRFRIHPAAAAEADQALEWYDDQVAGLGAGFLAELARAIGVLQEFPEMWPIWPDVDSDGQIRRCLLTRFSYGVAYAVTDEAIVIYAVAHLARRPGYWQDRIDDDPASFGDA